MNKTSLVIDLGSKNICMYQKDNSVILNEPSVIVVKNVKGEMSPVACGSDALKLLSKPVESQQVVYPVKEGAVVNEPACVFLIKAMISRFLPQRTLLKPHIRAIVCISCGLSNVEKRTIEAVCNKAGIGEVTLVESPLAVAALIKEDEAFIVDLGGSKTEIAVTNNSGIVTGCSIDLGGDKLNQAISDYVSDKYKVIIQNNTAEKIKLGAGSLLENDITSATVTGKSIFEQSSKKITLSAAEIREAILPLVGKIAEVIESVSLMIPDNMIESIFNSGVYLCGGGAELPGIAKYIANRLKMKVTVLENPSEAVANGGVKFFYDNKRLAKLLNIGNLTI